MINIKDIESYNQKIIGGDLILIPKKKYVTENELNMINIAKSKINKCLIKDKEDKIISTNTKYRSILTDIYKTMATQKILQATRFNFKLTNENGEKGYHWNDDIHMSFQNKNARETLKEIINMVKVNKLTIDISIKLETDSVVNFKIK